MRNVISIIDTDGNAQTGLDVDVYVYHASDTGGASPNGSKIGDCTEIAGTGQYYYDVSGDSIKVTVVVEGLCDDANIGIQLDGETARDNSVNESAIVDSSVTQAKTTFVRDY